MDNSQLLSQLKSTSDELRNFTQGILEMPDALLRKIPSTKGWSVLQCYDHMNKATEVYLNQIENKIGNLKKENGPYKKSLLAKWFTQGLAPTKEGHIKHKMKTMKPFQADDSLDRKVVERFLNNLNRFDKILVQVQHSDLRSFKVTTALGPILKFYLGDALDFVHAHNLRHAQQIKNTLADLSDDNQKAA